MGRPLFMMSLKKRNEIKQEEERRERAEMKVRKELFTPKPVKAGSVSKFPKYTHRSSDVQISRPETTGGSTAKITSHVYTGDKMIGVAVMHKSCLQPIFSQEAAVDSATMRRG